MPAARSATGGAGKLLRPLLALLTLVLVVVASVAGTWYFMSRYQQQQLQAAMQLGIGQQQGQAGATGPVPTTYTPPPAPPAVVPAPIFFPLEAFTVTINDAESERIMHVGLTLRLGDEQSRQRIERYMPEVRNRILMVMSSQTPQSVQSLAGKQAMAKSLQAAINKPFAPLPDGQAVSDVLFTAFVVQ
ncbi:flagellar basal body-associated FliL family protein [Bordetella holmesii 35009]|nr:flagellar basal body-associated FliL family protein [Bordetella holmesii 35009]